MWFLLLVLGLVIGAAVGFNYFVLAILVLALIFAVAEVVL